MKNKAKNKLLVDCSHQQRRKSCRKRKIPLQESQQKFYELRTYLFILSDVYPFNKCMSYIIFLKKI